MNPNSHYYLSFNLGFPNAYDRANGRTGAHLMVHGDCSSRGCYAMTDEQIGGNLRARPRRLLRRPEIVPGAGLSVPHDGAEHGQASQQPEHAVLADAEGRQRSFRGRRSRSRRSTSATSATCSMRSRQRTRASFSPAAKCPAYVVPEEIASRSRDKQQQDERSSPIWAAATSRPRRSRPAPTAACNRCSSQAAQKDQIRRRTAGIFSLVSTAPAPFRRCGTTSSAEHASRATPSTADGSSVPASRRPRATRVAAADPRRLRLGGHRCSAACSARAASGPAAASSSQARR